MTDTFEFTLDNPLTEEQWDMITDVDFDHTDRIAFRTKHGKEVEFAKVIRCKDCKFVGTDATCCLVCKRDGMGLKPFHVYHDDYCSYAERKEE